MDRLFRLLRGASHFAHLVRTSSRSAEVDAPTVRGSYEGADVRKTKTVCRCDKKRYHFQKIPGRFQVYGHTIECGTSWYKDRVQAN